MIGAAGCAENSIHRHKRECNVLLRLFDPCGRGGKLDADGNYINLNTFPPGAFGEWWRIEFDHRTSRYRQGGRRWKVHQLAKLPAAAVFEILGPHRVTRRRPAVLLRERFYGSLGRIDAAGNYTHVRDYASGTFDGEDWQHIVSVDGGLLLQPTQGASANGSDRRRRKMRQHGGLPGRTLRALEQHRRLSRSYPATSPGASTCTVGASARSRVE